MTKPTITMDLLKRITLQLREYTESKQCKVCGLTVADYEPRMTQGNNVYHIACMNNA